MITVRMNGPQVAYPERLEPRLGRLDWMAAAAAGPFVPWNGSRLRRWERIVGRVSAEGRSLEGLAERGIREVADDLRIRRCGRQGDPGTCEAILSLEDELITVYGGRLWRRLGVAKVRQGADAHAHVGLNPVGRNPEGDPSVVLTVRLPRVCLGLPAPFRSRSAPKSPMEEGRDVPCPSLGLSPSRQRGTFGRV